MWQIAKDGDWAARRQLQKQFPVVSWHDDKVGGLDANWNCEAPISELCIFKQMIQNVIAFFFSCPPHLFGKATKGCGKRPPETTAGGYLEHLSQCLSCTVTPCPAKSSGQGQLVPPGHQAAGMHEVSSLWLCVTLAVLVSLMLLSYLFTFQKMKCFLLLGSSDSCPDPAISISLPAWPSCSLAMCCFKGMCVGTEERNKRKQLMMRPLNSDLQESSKTMVGGSRGSS